MQHSRKNADAGSHGSTPGLAVACQWGLLWLLAVVVTACGTPAGSTPLSPPVAGLASGPVGGAPLVADGSPFLKPADDQLVVPASSLASEERRLALILGNQWTFMKNGGTVDLGKGLSVELSMDPYPPNRLWLSLDIHLTRQGDSVTDARVDIEYDMLGMAHGPFTASADNLGGGHYRAALDYEMFSVYEHTVTVYLPEGHHELHVGIDVFPTARKARTSAWR